MGQNVTCRGCRLVLRKRWKNSRWCQRCKPRWDRTRPKVGRAKIWAAWCTGTALTYQELADHFGVTRQRIAQVVHEMLCRERMGLGA